MSFSAAEKLVGQISLKNEYELKIKFLLPVCQILRNFTEGNAGKSTVSFLKPTQDKREFWFEFFNFAMRFSVWEYYKGGRRY